MYVALFSLFLFIFVTFCSYRRAFKNGRGRAGFAIYREILFHGELVQQSLGRRLGCEWDTVQWLCMCYISI